MITMEQKTSILDSLLYKVKPQVSKTELAHFKNLLEKSRLQPGNHTIYAEFVKKTWIYRAIFGGIALFFFYLAIAIHPQSISWSASLLFGSILSTKNLLVTGCVALGGIASVVAFFLCHTKELVRFKTSKTYRELWKIHNERRLKKRITWTTSCVEKLHLRSVLHHLYRDVCDKIDDACRETEALIVAIETREKMTPEYQERLIEQALDELDARLNQHLENFRSSWIE